MRVHPATPLTTKSVPPPRAASGMALVSGERILAASPALAELTGYTRGELTSPEFRLSHLFARGAAQPPIPASENDVASDTVVVVPLRGSEIVCHRSVLRIGGGSPPILALAIEPGGEPLPPDAREAKLQAAREVMRACSSQLAGAILRLRRLQLQIETLEHEHPEVLLHEMRRAGAVVEALEKLEEDVEGLARAAISASL